VYDRNISGTAVTFGVSGLLYKGNLLMYDHQTLSLWSQVRREAVTGQMTGTRLAVLPSTVMTWHEWKKRFPETEVLSTDTGHIRNYNRDPYENYYKRKKGLFSFFKGGPGEKEKELIAGITIDGEAKAYPIDLLRKKSALSDSVSGKKITFTFDKKTGFLIITDSKNNNIDYITTYWFVWKGLHPETRMFRMDK
jgi:hypothetical protein